MSGAHPIVLPLGAAGAAGPDAPLVADQVPWGRLAIVLAVASAITLGAVAWSMTMTAASQAQRAPAAAVTDGDGRLVPWGREHWIRQLPALSAGIHLDLIDAGSGAGQERVLDAEQQARSFSWADRPAGLVRVPIAVAEDHYLRGERP
jgi:hypothetical protein